jgi:hypothetical protein
MDHRIKISRVAKIDLPGVGIPSRFSRRIRSGPSNQLEDAMAAHLHRRDQGGPDESRCPGNQDSLRRWMCWHAEELAQFAPGANPGIGGMTACRPREAS